MTSCACTVGAHNEGPLVNPAPRVPPARRCTFHVLASRFVKRTLTANQGAHEFSSH